MNLSSSICLSASLSLALISAATSVDFSLAQAATSASNSTEPAEPPSAVGLFWAHTGSTTWTRLAPNSVQVNPHSGSNFAGEVAGSVFYKPRVTFEVQGTRADARLLKGQTEFFLKLHRGELDPIDSKMIDVDIVLVRAHVQGDRRVIVKMNYSGLTGRPSERNQDEILTTQSEVGTGDWTRVSPAEPLNPGEYALVFLPKRKEWNTRIVLDFGIDSR
jgi:hypothetical protein